MVDMYHDLLAKIKNAVRARKDVVRVPFSNMDFAVLKLLMQERYVKDVRKKTFEKKHVIEIELERNDAGRYAIKDFKLVSKPSRRIYMSYRVLRPVRQGYGLGVLSTPEGVLSVKEARKRKVGGEYLFEIW